jgi:phosphoribosylformylglycinamidine synthase
MWQFSEAVKGIGDAAAALGTPVTGGNVSFYNETNGRPIFPTPVIGMLGVLHAADQSVGLGFGLEGDVIILAGDTAPDDFGGSEYAKTVNGVIAGRPPKLDIEREKSLAEFLYDAAGAGLLHSAHDPSGGGLAIALAESAICGGIGFKVQLPEGEPHRIMFSESPSRAVISCGPERAERVHELLGRHGVPAAVIGEVGGSQLDYGVVAVPLFEAVKGWEETLPTLLGPSAG